MDSHVPTLLYYAIPTAIVLYGIRKYRERKWGRCTNGVSLRGKVVVVTGANCGIGYETAKELAKRGAEVVLACRNEDAAHRAMEKMEREIGNKLRLVFVPLDLASLESVRQFAENIKNRYNQIHILVNNAGVSYPDNSRTLTKDGYEIQFAVNHLGHFYLTNLLLDRLESGNPSRIVVVSSRLFQKGCVDFNSFDKDANTKNLYANSKLMNVYFCKELAKKVKGKGISVYAVCPGWVLTNLFRHDRARMMKFFVLILPLAFFYMRSAKQGAQTSIYCATEPDIEEESGSIYRDCQKFETKVQFCEVVSKKLWATSVSMIEDKGLEL